MRELTSGVKGKILDQGFVNKVNSLAWQKNREQNQASAQQVGLVSNYDPDQRGFLTPAMQGYTAVQTDKTGLLVANPDFGVSSRYQNPDRTDLISISFINGFNESYLPFLGIEDPDQVQSIPVGNDFIYYGPSVSRFSFPGGRQIRPQPGQPVFYQSVVSGSPNISTTVMRGGKTEQYREYPHYALAGQFGSILFLRRGDVNFINPQAIRWDSNSPLPPGCRWLEAGDLIYGIESESMNPPLAITDEELSIYLPHDMDDHPRVNVKPLPAGMWSMNLDIYNDDSYWTGQVRNPLDWVDSFWYGSGKNIDRKGLETYLNEHPGCRFV